MNFIIGEKIPKHEDGYELTINTMIGDADGYEDVIIGTFKEHELHLLEEVVNVCERMDKAYPHGRGGGDSYDHIEGFKKWFEEDSTESESVSHLLKGSWAYDPSCYDIQNSIDGYNVTYYLNGEGYTVEIIR